MNKNTDNIIIHVARHNKNNTDNDHDFMVKLKKTIQKERKEQATVNYSRHTCINTELHWLPKQNV